MGSESRRPLRRKRSSREIARERAKRLIERIETGRLDVSHEIAQALRTKALASDTSTDLDVLAELLRDPDDDVRTDAARCIDFLARTDIALDGVTAVSGLRYGNSQTVSLLQAGLENETPAVRRHLLSAYARLQFGERSELLPILLERLRDHIEDVRLEAVRAIRVLGVDLASEGVDLLAELLAAPEGAPGIRGEACAALQWLGPDAAAAVPILVEQIASEPASSALRWRMGAALVAIDPEGDELAGVCEPSHQQSLLRVLRELGPAGRTLRRRLPSRWMEAADTSAVDQSPWMTKVEIARRLKCDPKTVTRMLKDGRLDPSEMRCRGKRESYRINEQTLERLRKLRDDH